MGAILDCLESLRCKHKEHPQQIADENEGHCKKIIRVTDPGQVWCYRDVSDKLRKKFGRMVGL